MNLGMLPFPPTAHFAITQQGGVYERASLKKKNTPTDNPSTFFPPVHTPSILKVDFPGLPGAPNSGERLETQNNLSPKLEEPPKPWWPPATPVSP